MSSDLTIEPIVDEPAAVASLPNERLLLIADYHAGYEIGMRFAEGVQVPDRSAERRRQLCDLITRTNADRLVILGDLTHSIGEPKRVEQGELTTLFEAIDIPVLIAKGNHDGILEEFLEEAAAPFTSVSVLPARGARIGRLSVMHGHTWPTRDVLQADIVCLGHEHPQIQLTDSVGGTRGARIWLRGPADTTSFVERINEPIQSQPELVVFPAYNDLCGGTWINDTADEFLAPFLPAALPSGTAYLLDGTELGDYHWD